MGYNDIFTLVSQAIQQSLNGQASIFQGTGLSLWSIFATIIVLFFGIEWIFSPGSMTGSRVVRLIIQLLICKTVLLFYATPIFGQSFTGLVMNEANYITNTLGQKHYDQLDQAVTNLQTVVPDVSGFDVKDAAIYLTIEGFAYFVKALAFFMASFGFIVQGILLLFGPLFIPFYIVPQLDFLAWNWFKAFLAYSFYGVIGNAYAYVYSSIVIAMFKQIGTMLQQPNSGTLQAIGGLMFLSLIGVAGFLLIPSIVSHIFGGQSGADASGALVGAAAGAATSAVAKAAA